MQEQAGVIHAFSTLFPSSHFSHPNFTSCEPVRVPGPPCRPLNHSTGWRSTKLQSPPLSKGINVSFQQTLLVLSLIEGDPPRMRFCPCPCPCGGLCMPLVYMFQIVKDLLHLLHGLICVILAPFLVPLEISIPQSFVFKAVETDSSSFPHCNVNQWKTLPSSDCSFDHVGHKNHFTKPLFRDLGIVVYYQYLIF